MIMVKTTSISTNVKADLAGITGPAFLTNGLLVGGEFDEIKSLLRPSCVPCCISGTHRIVRSHSPHQFGANFTPEKSHCRIRTMDRIDSWHHADGLIGKVLLRETRQTVICGLWDVIPLIGQVAANFQTQSKTAPRGKTNKHPAVRVFYFGSERPTQRNDTSTNRRLA